MIYLTIVIIFAALMCPDAHYAGNLFCDWLDKYQYTPYLSPFPPDLIIDEFLERAVLLRLPVLL